jgi:hypothetical protein
MAQSRTAVNAKAAAGDSTGAPGASAISPSLVPGQSINDVGGDTPRNAQSDNDASKLNVYAGAPGQVSGDPQQKGASPAGLDGPGPAAPGQGKIGDNVIPGQGSYDGTKPGRSNEGPDKLDKGKASYAPMGPGKSEDPKDGHTGSLSGGTERRTTGQSKTYEHIEVDEKAQGALDELAENQGASDDFKTKARIIFEGALNQKLQLEVSRLEEEFSQRFEQEITDIAEKVESFLNYTSQQWLEENKLVVENGIRNELSESFMQGLRSLFEDHYVTLPDEKYDIFESMVAKLDDMEDKLNEQIEANVTLSSQMSGFQRQSILSDVSWDLSEAGKEKMAGLAESVEFESEENYRKKLNILKESFVSTQAEPQQETEYLEESAEAPAPGPYDGMSSSMAQYAAALSRTLK